jgi:class 3 adenylate cyclase
VPRSDSRGIPAPLDRRWRPPFSLALVALVVAVTAVTGIAIGALGWREQRETARTLLEAAMTRTARLTAADASRFLTGAESAARLGPELVAGHQLDVDDTKDVERFVLAVLRAHPELTWVSFGGRDERFVGAWRDAQGAVYLNRSFPRDGRIRLEEDRLLPEGGRVPVRRSDDHGYRPTQRPYFRAAEASRAVVWTEPYEYYAGGGLGITCAAPVLDESGVRGVFTVDFSLERLARFFDTIEVSPRGRVFVTTHQGALLIGQTPRPTGRRGVAADADLIAGITTRVQPDVESAFALEHNGERYIGRAVPLTVGNLRWLAHVVVPERDYTEPADARLRVAFALGAFALLVAGGSGVLVARWLEQPLRELAANVRRIRRGDLDLTLVPRSRDAIGVLTRAMNELARALRDREIIRATLSRYVSPELAERALRDPAAVGPGGEVRHVAVLMADLRGFSALSERLDPETLADVVNRYLGRMTPVIMAHGGTINDFLGDGILVVFGAAAERPDDADRAVRCAWQMQRAIEALNAENRADGLPTLAMGIGLHAGRVMAGNLGSVDRMKYGVIGLAVNVAARIQALAEGGVVLVSEAALAHITDPAMRVGPPRRARVKGIEEPIAVHVLLGFADGDASAGSPSAPVVEHSGGTAARGGAISTA